MTSDLRARPLRLYAGEQGDDDEGMERGARLGVPPPDWHEGDIDGPDDRPDSGEAAGGGRRLARGAFVVLALAGFLGVLWYAYQWGLGGDEAVDLPVIAADPGPEKARPDDPGGLQVPYQDQLVLNEADEASGGLRVERLLPPPEVPLPPPAPELDAMAADAPGEVEEAVVMPVPSEAMAEAEASTDLTTALTTDLDTALATAAGPAEPASASEAPEAPAPALPKPEAASEPTTAPVAGQVPQPTATAAAPQVAAAAGGYVLQLASLKSSDAADREWARLKKSFPELLGAHAPIVQPADIQGVGSVYRLQVGGFPTRAAAADICTQLKSRQQDCFVVRR